MFRELLKNKKAQNFAEYALLIALVIAGVVAMQTYVQRAMQANMRNAAQGMTANLTVADGVNKVDQYEPYYMQSDYNVTKNAVSNKIQGQGTTAYDSTSNRTRAGSETTTYDVTSNTGH